MNEVKIIDFILELIDSHKEGEWWDFKECFAKSKTDLIHDIICLANQSSKNNGYLIFGVRDKTFEIVGVECDEHRKNQQQIIDVLRNVPFAGDYRPDISLETIIIANHEIDVLIVNNTSNVPYFLSKDYGEQTGGPSLHKGYIYTRVGDTNTPKNATADFYKTELLWRKRFGLNDGVMDRLHIALDDYNNWVFDWGNKRYSYNKFLPEFQMVISGDFAKSWWPLAAFYTAPIMHTVKLNVMIYNTVIYETELWALDEFKKFVPKADNKSIIDDKGEVCWFHYYLLDGIEGKMFRIFTQGRLNLNSRELDYNQVLLFHNEKELDSFCMFFKDHIKTINISDICERYQFAISNDSELNGGGLNFSALHVAIAAEIYKKWKEINVMIYE